MGTKGSTERSFEHNLFYYRFKATPQLHAKRKGLHGRRIRPKSVVDCIEGISADDIPDLLPSLPRTIEGIFPILLHSTEYAFYSIY